MDTSTPSYRVGVISMIQEEEDAILACFSAFFGDFELGRLTKLHAAGAKKGGLKIRRSAARAVACTKIHMAVP